MLPAATGELLMIIMDSSYEPTSTTAGHTVRAAVTWSVRQPECAPCGHDLVVT
jgi:hypothetical protein